MKSIVLLVSLFAAAATNAQYLTIFNLIKENPEVTTNMICKFNKTTEAHQNLATGKFISFLDNSTYTRYHFDCKDTDYGQKCHARVNETVCETGYEGEFCGHYGGYASLVKCKKGKKDHDQMEQ